MPRASGSKHLAAVTMLTNRPRFRDLTCRCGTTRTAASHLVLSPPPVCPRVLLLLTRAHNVTYEFSSWDRASTHFAVRGDRRERRATGEHLGDVAHREPAHRAAGAVGGAAQVRGEHHLL